MELSDFRPPKVFISYSHDSREHEDRVLSLADRLRKDGVEASIDQYNPSPPQGWPIWMNSEIQKADFVVMVCTETYLRRVENREEPGKGRGVLWEAKLIYNDLYLTDSPRQKYIPTLLNGGLTGCIPLPLRGLTHYAPDTDEGYEGLYRHLTNQPEHKKPELGKLEGVTAKEPQSYPASLDVRELKSPAPLDLRNRLVMLKRVRQDWIDGVLNQSLYKVARIELNLEPSSDAVDLPINAVVQVPDRSPTLLPKGTAITDLYDNVGEALLILGAPGTGKTTLLLELAQGLLDRASQDQNYPIPVVFNLSTWAVRRQPLDLWLVAELNQRSGVPKGLAQSWVESEGVLPLLDGLDEVDATHRQACVEAINRFRSNHGLLPIAVCSRIADYEALGKKLRLRSAVVIQPLTESQVEGYLARSADSQPLRTAMQQNSSLTELLETPLMLWVALLAYRDTPVELVAGESSLLTRQRLFASFVNSMFKRRSVELRYSQEDTVRWLSWLASALAKSGQTVFYIRNLEMLRLPAGKLRWILTIMRGIVGGLFGWLAGMVLSMNSDPEARLISELGLGVALGLLGFAEPRPSENIQSRFRDVGHEGLSAMPSERRVRWFGLVFTLFFPLPALIGAGVFALRHYVLCFVLWAGSLAPLNYRPFLDYAAERLFLQKVGGGYIFIHRMLLEYFASLSDSANTLGPPGAKSAVSG